jgi:dipeptidase
MNGSGAENICSWFWVLFFGYLRTELLTLHPIIKTVNINLTNFKMKFSHRINHLILTGSLFLLVSFNVLAGEGYTQKLDCFSFVVGKNASADGSVIFAHNEDTGPLGVNYYKVPGKFHQPGEEIIMERGARVPQAAVTYGYLWINIPSCDVCDSYVNEYGVSVGSDGCPSREDKPELKDGGIVFWLRRIIAERAGTAREGVKIAGRLIEEYGYASSGRSYIIADKNEGWVLAVVYGKHWVAQRVPDDKVAVIPNCYTIEGIDLSDTVNFLGSLDIIDYAIQRGWYDPSRDGEFNFARAYSNPGSLTHPGNSHRMWRGIELVSGEKYNITRQLPFAVNPAGKLSVPNIMTALRDHYEGPLLDDSGEAASEELLKASSAAICRDRTQYSLIAHLRNRLPAEIAPVAWIAMYQPDLQAYCAWYPAMTTIPDIYSTGDYVSGLQQHLDNIVNGTRSQKSAAYLKFVSLNDKIRSGTDENIAFVKKEWSAFENGNFRAQAKFEKRIVSIIGKDRDKAIRKITDYASTKAVEVYENADKLINKL